jgi:hypothetical protein
MMRLARTVMAESGFGGRFWFKAALTGKDARNVTYKQRLGLTPYSCIYGELKDVSSFHTFGCRAWVYVNAERREKGKHTSRAQEAIYLGFEPNTRAFLFFIPESKHCGQRTKHSLTITCSLFARELSSISSNGIIQSIFFFRLHRVSSGLLAIAGTQAIIQRCSIPQGS